MKNEKCFSHARKAGFVLNTVLLIALTSGASSLQAQGIHITIAPPVIAVSPPVVVIPDNYVYYPSYGVYYNTTRHQYAYMDGSVWVNRPAPLGVSAEVLLASPSVQMDFHDSPSFHHKDMIRKYPRSYKPAHLEHSEHSDHPDHDKH